MAAKTATTGKVTATAAAAKKDATVFLQRDHTEVHRFFRQYDRLVKGNADVVEVYYVCMLIGFKGKYKVYMEDQLQEVIKNTAAQLKSVGRLQETDLSPHWKVRDQPEPPRDSSLPLWAKVGAAVGLVLVVLIYLVLLLLLTLNLRAAEGQLTR